MLAKFCFALTILYCVASPLSADAQPANRIWRIGLLATANPTVYEDVVDELQRLGYGVGRNLAVVARSADGRPERLPALAAELVQAGVDVIVVGGGDAPVRAARQATSTIPNRDRGNRV